MVSKNRTRTHNCVAIRHLVVSFRCCSGRQTTRLSATMARIRRRKRASSWRAWATNCWASWCCITRASRRSSGSTTATSTVHCTPTRRSARAAIHCDITTLESGTYTTSVSHKPRSTQPGHPSVGRRNECRRKLERKQTHRTMHYLSMCGLEFTKLRKMHLRKCYEIVTNSFVNFS